MQVLARTISLIDANRIPINASGKGEPRLGKRGLYGSIGGVAPAAFEHALLWVLSLADGSHDLVAMAERSGLPFESLHEAAVALEREGLVHRSTNRRVTKRRAMKRGLSE